MPCPLVCVFSKHLQFLDYSALAQTCKDTGLDGVDLAVRRGGHVEPDTVARDLPRAVEAVRAQGLDVPMITTALCRGDDPDARPILEAAASLGIRYARVGWQSYGSAGNPFDMLPKFTEELRTLAMTAKEYGVAAAYHNHSGENNVSAPVWDLHAMIREINLDSLGSSFDVAHATIEGGLAGWNLSTRLMAPYVKVMAVKDFIWNDKKLHWCPLGAGQVKTVAMLKIIREAGFQGPISMHFEYAIVSNDAMIEEIRKTAITVRRYLEMAGYG